MPPESGSSPRVALVEFIVVRNTVSSEATKFWNSNSNLFPAFDISADLVELGRTPVAVVCAGAKSILDIPKTLEFLVYIYNIYPTQILPQ